MKTVLITGASSGIGKELSYVFAENKFNLVLAARRQDRLMDLKKDIESKHQVSADVIAIDLSKTDSAEKLYKQVGERNIKIDVLINNAGFGIIGDFKTIDSEREESMLVLNMVTLTKLTRLFTKDMIEAGGGHIINIASTAAFQPVPRLSAYSATKAYVLNFSEAIAYELKDDNVKVTAICPGATQSEFADVAGFSEGSFSKMPTSRELAEFTFKAMKKGKVTAIYGAKNRFLIFTLRLIPRNLITKIAAKMME